jgi:hypothetical protein
LSDAALPASLVSPRQLKVCRWVVLGFIAGLYLVSLSPHWLPGNDSALYRLLGRSLARGEGYSLWGKPHVHVPPGFPLLLAGLEKLGLESSLALNAVIMALSGATLLLAYCFLRRHVWPELALWITLLFALCNHWHDVSMQLLSDVPCIALVALGLWSYVRWSRWGRGLPELGTAALIAAGWVRLAAMPLAVGAAVGLLLERPLAGPGGGRPDRPVRAPRLRRVLNALVLVAGVAATAWIFYLHYKAAGRGPGAPSYGHHLDAVSGGGLLAMIGRMGANLYGTSQTLSRLFTSQRMPVHMPWLATLLFALPVLGGMILHLRRRQFICVFAATAYLGAITVFRVPIARYLLPVGFLLMLYWSEAVAAAFLRLGRLRRALPHVLAGLLILLSVAHLPRDVRRIIWVHHPDFLGVYRHGGPRALYEMAGWLEDNARAKRFLSAADTYSLAFLSGREGVPVSEALLRRKDAPEVLASLFDRQGADVLILQPGDQPEAFEVMGERALRQGRIVLAHDNGVYRAYWHRPSAVTTQSAPAR